MGTGRRFEVGYAAAYEAFTEVLESRKEGLGGAWFTAPGESSKEAFMRRLKRADPAFEIYEAYAAEHTEKWAGAKALSMADAMAEMPEIERKYNLECSEYDAVIFGLNDECSDGQTRAGAAGQARRHWQPAASARQWHLCRN